MRANKKELCSLLVASTICVSVTANSYAQVMEARPPQAPTPGASTTGSIPLPPPAPPATPSGTTSNTSAPNSSGSAPLPGASDTQVGGPGRLTSVISLHDAQVWADRFKSQTTSVSPQSLEQLSAFYEWLLELLDEHNRLAAIFAKNENTKAMADAERQTVSKFSHLKIEVLLLKAELLIKLNRYAEAIVPLVDIVNAEPLSAAGKEAYKDLQDIGFSEIPAYTSQSPDSLQPSGPSAINGTATVSPAPAKTTPKASLYRATSSAATKNRRTRYSAYRIR